MQFDHRTVALHDALLNLTAPSKTQGSMRRLTAKANYLRAQKTITFLRTKVFVIAAGPTFEMRLLCRCLIRLLCVSNSDRVGYAPTHTRNGMIEAMSVCLVAL